MTSGAIVSTVTESPAAKRRGARAGVGAVDGRPQPARTRTNAAMRRNWTYIGQCPHRFTVTMYEHPGFSDEQRTPARRNVVPIALVRDVWRTSISSRTVRGLTALVALAAVGACS